MDAGDVIHLEFVKFFNRYNTKTTKNSYKSYIIIIKFKNCPGGRA